MNEELEQVQEEINNLRDRLAALYNKEKTLKKETPPDLVGKYIYQKYSVFEMYMRVDSIEWSDSLECYVAIGPAIDVTTRLIGIKYSLFSNNTFNLSEKYKIINKEEYDKVLSEALKSF